MATIDVQKKSETQYRVTIIPDEGFVTQHSVTLHPEYHRLMTGGAIAPEKLIVASFEFLLGHESNDAILPEFDLPDISIYFPSYEKEIGRILSSGTAQKSA